MVAHREQGQPPPATSGGRQSGQLSHELGAGERGGFPPHMMMMMMMMEVVMVVEVERRGVT